MSSEGSDLQRPLLRNSSSSSQLKVQVIANLDQLYLKLASGDLFLCPLCNQERVEYNCTECKGFSCKQCNVQWLSKNKSCPFCRRQQPKMIHISRNKRLWAILEKIDKGLLQPDDIQKAFKCPICKRLVKEAKECGHCHDIFCKSCF